VQLYLSKNGNEGLLLNLYNYSDVSNQIWRSQTVSITDNSFSNLTVWNFLFVSSFNILYLKFLCLLAKAVSVLRLLRHGRCRRCGHRRPTFHHFVAIDHVRNFLDDFNNSSIYHIDFHWCTDVFRNGIDVFNGFRDRDDIERDFFLPRDLVVNRSINDPNIRNKIVVSCCRCRSRCWLVGCCYCSCCCF
jgi:hypothetical protein